MKVVITVLIEDTDEDEVNISLISSETEGDILWTKTEEYPVGPDYALSIVTDLEMSQIKAIPQRGNLILTPEKEIRELFLDALLNLKLERQADEADGIEHIHNEEDTQAYKEADTPEIVDQKPYDPKLIRVDTKPFSTFISTADFMENTPLM